MQTRTAEEKAVNVMIPLSLHKRLKLYAVRSDLRLKHVLSDLVRQFLDRVDKK